MKRNREDDEEKEGEAPVDRQARLRSGRNARYYARRKQAPRKGPKHDAGAAPPGV